MKFSLAAAALTSSTLLSPTLALSIAKDSSAPNNQTDPRPISTTFKIKSFTLNTPPNNAESINSISFRILATTGGTLDFECKQYDATLNRFTTEGFQSDYVYRCADNTFFTWNFVPETSVLSLWQEVSDDVFLGGEVFIGEMKNDPSAEYLVAMRNLLQ